MRALPLCVVFLSVYCCRSSATKCILFFGNQCVCHLWGIVSVYFCVCACVCVTVCKDLSLFSFLRFARMRERGGASRMRASNSHLRMRRATGWRRGENAFVLADWRVSVARCRRWRLAAIPAQLGFPRQQVERKLTRTVALHDVYLNYSLAST